MSEQRYLATVVDQRDQSKFYRLGVHYESRESYQQFFDRMVFEHSRYDFPAALFSVETWSGPFDADALRSKGYKL